MKKICCKCYCEFDTKKNGATRKYCFDCVPDNYLKDGNSLKKIIKKWSLDYKGGKCEKCGYNKSILALEFHHLDPKEKEFSISDIKLDWENIKKELDKCILVCANCHREIHEKITVEKNYEKSTVSNAKRVICTTTNEIFGSSKLAADYYSLNSGDSHIREVCNGTRKSCGKDPLTGNPLYWDWVDITEEEKLKILKTREEKNKLIIRNNFRKVQASTGEIFESIAEAARWAGLKNYYSITNVCKGKAHTAGKHPVTNEKLSWGYINEE